MVSGFDSVSTCNGLHPLFPRLGHHPWTVYETSSMRTLFFCWLIFIATSVYSAGVLGSVHNVDILILLHMFFGDVYSVYFEILSLERRVTPISAWGTRYRYLVISGMSAYAVWFWFVGLYRLPDGPCGSVAFLFAEVALRGRAEIFFKIVAVANLSAWGVFGLLALMAFPFDPYLEYSKARTSRKTRYFYFKRDHSNQDPRRVLGLALSSNIIPHSKRHEMPFQTPEFWRIFQTDHPYVWKLLRYVSTDNGIHSQYKGRTRFRIRLRQL